MDNPFFTTTPTKVTIPTTDELIDGIVELVKIHGDITMDGVRRYAAARGMNVDRPPRGGYKKPHWLPLLFTMCKHGEDCYCVEATR